MSTDNLERKINCNINQNTSRNLINAEFKFMCKAEQLRTLWIILKTLSRVRPILSGSVFEVYSSRCYQFDIRLFAESEKLISQFMYVIYYMKSWKIPVSQFLMSSPNTDIISTFENINVDAPEVMFYSPFMHNIALLQIWRFVTWFKTILMCWI